MEMSLETHELKNCVMKRESSMSSQPSTLRSKMVLLKGKIGPWLIWQDQCSPGIIFWIVFGPKQSTRLVMLRIDYIVIDFTTRSHMNCSLEGNQISYILECLVANAIFSRRELGYKSFKANVMRVFFLDIHLIARLIGSTTNSWHCWRSIWCWVWWNQWFS